MKRKGPTSKSDRRRKEKTKVRDLRIELRWGPIKQSPTLNRG